jgi:hypothetical protein
LNAARQYIRIVTIPPGEAPLWVREKWVGLELPIADDDAAPHEAYISGVLSGPRNRFFAFVWRLFGRLDRQSGYPVYVNEALDILEKSAPDAAAWWRENTSRLQHQGRKFLFRSSSCELLVDRKAVTTETSPKDLPQRGAAIAQGATGSPVPHIPLPVT